MAIDELGQVDSRSADQMAYMLGNGQTKGRSSREGMARPTTDFRLIFFSTGEVGLSTKLAEGNKTARAGQFVRMIEIPADAEKGMGIFEDIHHFENAAAFADYLNHATHEHQGHAIKVFLEKILHQDSEKLTKLIKKLMEQWTNSVLGDKDDSQIKRVAKRFAIIAVAGELAIQFKILPWKKGEAFNAAKICFKSWIEQRGGTTNYELQNGLNKILNFVERFGESRFSNFGGEQYAIRDRAGFRKLIMGNNSSADVYEYYIFNHVLREEILDNTPSFNAILRYAVEAKLIISDGDGKSSQLTTHPEIPELKGKRNRMYHICPFQYYKENET